MIASKLRIAAQGCAPIHQMFTKTAAAQSNDEITDSKAKSTVEINDKIECKPIDEVAGELTEEMASGSTTTPVQKNILKKTGYQDTSPHA